MIKLVEVTKGLSWEVLSGANETPIGTIYPSFGTLMFLEHGKTAWSADMLQLVVNSMQALKQELGMP